jgi:hypothetical protein
MLYVDKVQYLMVVAILSALYNLSENLYGLELSIYESTLYILTYPLILLIQVSELGCVVVLG